MTAQNPEALFQQVTQFIDESNTLLKDGAFVQLTDLDVQVDALCKEVLKLSGEQRVEYAERLQQVVASLQQLGENLAAARDEVNKQIGELPTHKKAHVAYQKMEASDKKKQGE
jgi:hypothetical protein